MSFLFFFLTFFHSYILLFKNNLDRSTTPPNFDRIRVWTHDLQIMNNTFHVPETLTLTTEPSGTSAI